MSSAPSEIGLAGLSVRWPLAQADDGIEQRLRDYVASASHAKFSQLPELAFKTWRMRAGEWFEGTYVFADPTTRAAFQETFTAGAATAPVSDLVGAGPTLIEAFEVVAVAEGGAGFTSFAG